MPSDHALSTSRLTLLLALALMLLVQSGCGTGSGQTNLALVGGAIRPSRQAYEVTPDAAAVLPLGATVEIPTHVDLRSDGVIPPVQNQIWNSCVGWSLGYYLMTAIEARRLRNAGLWLDMNDPENWFAPDFVYSQRDTHPLRLDAIDERVRRNDPISQPICFESDGDIGCMRPEKALAAIMKHGCCRWTWMCGVEGDPHYRPCGAGEHLEYERPSRAPWQFTITHSGYFRPRCYVRFGALDDLAQGTVRRMQSWLDREGTPIAIVVNMMSGWVTFGGENATDVVVQDPCGAEHVERRSVCLDAGGDDLGSQHMMTVIGYDRSYPSRAQ